MALTLTRDRRLGNSAAADTDRTSGKRLGVRPTGGGGPVAGAARTMESEWGGAGAGGGKSAAHSHIRDRRRWRRERRKAKGGLRCRRPLWAPLLTARHRTARLQWARAHQDWLLLQWRKVLFLDESRFGLVSDDYRERVWRERGGQNRLATAIVGYRKFEDTSTHFIGGLGLDYNCLPTDSWEPLCLVHVEKRMATWAIRWATEIEQGLTRYRVNQNGALIRLFG
nr:unnamed protein product [Callosobruchus chinensis]